jgi:hypothetical protein
MDAFKIILFFLVPLLVTGVVVSVLQRLSDDLDREIANRRVDPEERAGASADFSAKKVQRAKARRVTEPGIPPDVQECDTASQFEVPADFNLAEFSGREEPQGN